MAGAQSGGLANAVAAHRIAVASSGLEAAPVLELAARDRSASSRDQGRAGIAPVRRAPPDQPQSLRFQEPGRA
jgi:hypothetical protein